MDKKTWSVEIVPVNVPADLRETTRGSDVEIVQLKPGKLLGSIKHFGIGNLGISLGRFDSAIRMRGGACIKRELSSEHYSIARAA